LSNNAAASVPDKSLLRRLRRIAHHLNPVVSIGDAGLSDAVAAETERALHDHELIKVRIHSESRQDRKLLSEALAQRCEAFVVQSIGKVVVLYKQNPQPNPNLSNVLRHTLGSGRG
jgi:RNA-binding protein